MKKTDSILNSDYEGCVCIIEENITSESFEALMAHRGLEKIYRNTQITEGQKDLLIEKIASKIPDQKGKIINSYLFLKLFMPIGEEILAKMADRITRNFPDSLSVFYFCFGEFVTENPEIIGTAKNIMLSVAKKCLKDDTSAISYNLSLSLDNIYARCKTILHLLYEDSITYGVLLEKYDAISFGSEYIETIIEDKIPKMTMKLADPNFEYGLQCGVRYQNYIVRKRYNEEPGPIESFYKCVICKYCCLAGINDADKELALEVLKRQFANRNQTDLFFFFTGDYQSFILSILTCIYTQFLLLFFCSKQTMRILTKSEVRQKMLWGTQISTDTFNDCYRLVISDDIFSKTFLVENDNIVLGRWQFDLDLSVVELAKRISLNSKDSHLAGKNSNTFGKEIYEKIIRKTLEEQGWKIVPSSIKLKGMKQTRTDVDLIAYNQGIVIIGQVKFANSGRSRYDIWKATKSINKAVSQVNLSITIFSEDKNLLYSILKKYDFCESKEDIKKIVPVVITSSSYFIGECEKANIPVISWDMFSQIIYSLNYYNTLSDIDEYFSNIISLYDFNMAKEITNSEIENEKFLIKYEEFEG